jgi:hypothetical protein
MASKRHQRRKECSRKAKYASKREAEAIRRRRDRRVLKTYLCPHCGCWHLAKREQRTIASLMPDHLEGI